MRALLGFGDAREGLGENSAWRAIDQACCVGTTLDGDVDEFEFDAQSTSAPRPFAVDDSEGVVNSESCLVDCAAPHGSCMTSESADCDEADAALVLRVRQLEEALASADAEKQQLLARRDKQSAARSDKTRTARQEAGGARASAPTRSGAVAQRSNELFQSDAAPKRLLELTAAQHAAEIVEAGGLRRRLRAHRFRRWLDRTASGAAAAL